MNRFIHLAIIAVALSGFANATVITMNSAATFTGGLDLAINSPDDDNTTRLTSTLNPASSTIDFISLGQVDWLPLGTLRLGEGIAVGDTTPNIIANEYNNGYQLAVNIDTNLGLFNFLANSGLFTLNFSPGGLGGIDADTTDAAAEIAVDFSTLTQSVTVGLVTLQLSVVDNEFSSNHTLQFNQNATAATVWLRAEVTKLDQPPTGDVPESGTMALLGSGLLGVGMLAGRRKNNQPKFA
jgi:hypothetical protein